MNGLLPWLGVASLCLLGGLNFATAADGYGATQYGQAQRRESQPNAGNVANRTQTTESGVVIRILADDRDGSRHQRFIIRLDSGKTLLIAHNIDLAPRLAGLTMGERVRVSGEFVWNPQGGTLHWTHRDPQGHHLPGYVEWRGRRYQ